MLPKKNRLNTRNFEETFKNGFFLPGNTLNLKYFINRKDSKKQISFVVSKKLEKSAVNRNKLKRLGYRTVEKHLITIPEGFSGIFIFNKFDKNNLKNIELDAEINKLLSKIHKSY